MMKKNIKQLNWIVIGLLLCGVAFKLLVTGNNNIIFHMDTARDFVDIREMVELKKPRLIGPTSAIAGFYNGPGWYYLLLVPYLVFDGNPYSGVLLMIILWAIGGYFLYLITRKYGNFLWLIALLIWFASPSITLATQFSFNPSPVLFLTPLFIYLLEKYLTTEKIRWGIGTAILGGMFFQWEMNAGVFAPLIITTVILLLKKWYLFKTKNFWISCIVFLTTLLPQFIFDLRHGFMMTKSVLSFIGEGGGNSLTPSEKIIETISVFYNSFIPGLVENHYIIILLFILSVLYLPYYFLHLNIKNNLDLTLLITIVFIVVPFIGYLILPVKVHSWHMGQEVVATIILSVFLLSQFRKYLAGTITILVVLLLLIIYSWQRIDYQLMRANNVSDDPSMLRNELAAIDFAYQNANGENFDAFAYLPSVIDYPYQYLFWWYGLKEYGYTPTEYVYAENKPQYISNKDIFTRAKKDASDSGLIFLIKEPDHRFTRIAWEGEFEKYELIKKEVIGPLEVEMRRRKSIEN